MSVDSGCFIYFIQQGDGPVKIGHTNNIKKRLESLQIGNPELLLLRISMGPMSKKLAQRTEKLIHRRFADNSIRGEWYKACIFNRLENGGPLLIHGKADKAEIVIHSA